MPANVTKPDRGPWLALRDAISSMSGPGAAVSTTQAAANRMSVESSGIEKVAHLGSETVARLFRRGRRQFAQHAGASLALLLQALGHQEGQLQRVVGVEARVAVGVVAIHQVRLADGHGAARAL